MEEITLPQAEEAAEIPKNPIDEAYMQKIEALEHQIAEQKKDLERANAAFTNLLENRNSGLVANDPEGDFLNSIKRLLKK